MKSLVKKCSLLFFSFVIISSSTMQAWSFKSFIPSLPIITNKTLNFVHDHKYVMGGLIIAGLTYGVYKYVTTFMDDAIEAAFYTINNAPTELIEQREQKRNSINNLDKNNESPADLHVNTIPSNAIDTNEVSIQFMTDEEYNQVVRSHGKIEYDYDLNYSKAKVKAFINAIQKYFVQKNYQLLIIKKIAEDLVQLFENDIKTRKFIEATFNIVGDLNKNIPFKPEQILRLQQTNCFFDKLTYYFNLEKIDFERFKQQLLESHASNEVLFY